MFSKRPECTSLAGAFFKNFGTEQGGYIVPALSTLY